MSAKLRYDGKVVIVTGAGNGLGRSYALMFGALGANVVVNDLGGGTHGEGRSSAAAEKVVSEIEALGGRAVASADSVEDGEKIVKTALSAFGTVDIVINNAGILRDASFHKMTEEDWRLIQRVHLDGTKSVTQAAWPILRDKGYGRIVMTTSAAGIYGNFGQANYCAAKLGILGLANCLAEEGRGKNIFVNTIAPIAASRLTAGLLPPDLLERLSPEFITPLVGWLAHETCTETKGLFEVGAGYAAKVRWERSRGYAFAKGRAISPDDIAAKWAVITDFTDAEHPTSTNDTLSAMMAALDSHSLGGNEFIDLDAAARSEMVLESSYDERDLALYALGVGAARDPMDDSERRFVYELGDFQPLPTYAVMPQSNAMLAAIKEGTCKLPGVNFGLDRLLHGEQYTEIKQPLRTRAKLRHVYKLKHAYDKDPNAVVVFGISSFDESGTEVAYNEMTGFVKGVGGWGGDRGPSANINTPPDRTPDAVIEEKTDPNQTLLYRLSGDWNPLHVDPGFAKAFGYERPILHGMCTYGYVGRHVIKAMLNNDPRRFKSIKVRFAEPVMPGETLVTRMWKESESRVIVETRVKERDVVVIKNAAVELHTRLPQVAPAAPQQESLPGADPRNDRLLAEDVFAVIAEHVGAQPDLVGNTRTTFQFRITNPESAWVLDLKNAPGEVRSGVADKADVTLDLAEDLLPKIVTASLAEIQKLFFAGDLKVTGNVMASNKVVNVLKGIDQSRYEEARARRVKRPGQASAAAAVTAADGGSGVSQVAEDIFAVIAEHIASRPELAGTTKTLFQFHITQPDSHWVLDLKNGKGEVRAGIAEKADVTLELAQEILPSVVIASLGEIQKLYFGGQLKVSGNVMASSKLASVLQAIDKQKYEQAKAARPGRAAKPSDKAATSQAEHALVAAKPGRASEVFAALSAGLQAGPKARWEGPTPALIQFNVHAPESVWTLEITDASQRVWAGPATAGATTVLGIDDDDLASLAAGESNPQELFRRGKLRVDGDIRHARALSILVDLMPH